MKLNSYQSKCRQKSVIICLDNRSVYTDNDSKKWFQVYNNYSTGASSGVSSGVAGASSTGAAAPPAHTSLRSSILL